MGAGSRTYLASPLLTRWVLTFTSWIKGGAVFVQINIYNLSRDLFTRHKIPRDQIWQPQM